MIGALGSHVASEMSRAKNIVIELFHRMFAFAPAAYFISHDKDSEI